MGQGSSSYYRTSEPSLPRAAKDVVHNSSDATALQKLCDESDALKAHFRGGKTSEDWNGVVVTGNAPHRVIKLDLSNSRLTMLPDAIGELGALRELSLRKCSSLATLPDAIGELKALTKLDLHGCSSLTTLPAAIGELGALKMLDVRGCSSLEKLPDAVAAREGLTVVLPDRLNGPLQEDFAALRKLRDESECECEDSERLREGDKVEADYRGCLVRVQNSPFLSRVPRRRPQSECSHAGKASSIPERLRGTTAMIRTTSAMMTGTGRRASPRD